MRKWDKESIAAEIHALHEAGQDLNYSTISRSYIALLRAAARYFGSWRSAVEYAQIDYDSVRKYRRWTRERIIERIQELHKRGEDLSWRRVSSALDPQLAAAATKQVHFGSWRAAIHAAGLDYDVIRRYQRWDHDTVIRKLQSMHAEGKSLNAKSVEQADITLITAARRRFKTWDRALTAAGLNAKEIVLRSPYRRSGNKNKKEKVAGKVAAK